MGWLRLYITTEGQSERKFADDVLRPHLAEFSIDVKTRVVLTNRKLGKRGGILDFENIHGDLQRLMQEDSHPEARFTTMVDLYALPTEFPGGRMRGGKWCRQSAWPRWKRRSEESGRQPFPAVYPAARVRGAPLLRPVAAPAADCRFGAGFCRTGRRGAGDGAGRDR